MTASDGDTSRGAKAVADGVMFSVHAPDAERLELCLFDEAGRPSARHDMTPDDQGTWWLFLPGAAPGQRYGYRAHGRYAPNEGLRFNPAKLLVDPYARLLDGEFRWDPAVFDYDAYKLNREEQGLVPSKLDSADFMPKSVVTNAGAQPAASRPAVPWSDVIVYEANVRGYTMRHPDVPEADRGRFRGMTNGKIVSYLKSLGVTSIELMPVFEFADEHFLAAQGLRNFWGYNTFGFFTPAARYAGADPIGEFREMVNTLHDAGLEVILDVVYNHTAESGTTGPTLSFRGLDNPGYYRLHPDNALHYINDTGTGNTINADYPETQRLIVDSLRYWAGDMGVDGFRFDLAPVLGRSMDGFDPLHPLLRRIHSDPLLKNCKLIAEPWDPGPGGYHLGHFPVQWAEWNDRYRDSVRRFWRGDSDETAEFARRLHGSADIFDVEGRGPSASVNLVTAHDGFTLADVVAYEERHNEANGEQNRDGHAHNFSANYGVEGETEDSEVLKLRRQQRLNLLATLLLSQGTPMVLGGDELGNSQGGNNNVYAQDNEVGWVDWSGLDNDPQFLEAFRALVELRRDIPLFRQHAYLHGSPVSEVGWGEIAWLRPDGKLMTDADWPETQALSVTLSHTGDRAGGSSPAVVLLINASADSQRFALPDGGADREWQIRFVSAADGFRPIAGNRWQLPARSMLCVALDADA